MPDMLRAYLDRIRFEGTPAVDYETLLRLHRLHLLNISYENLDIHRGQTLTLDEQQIFDKIVNRRRGGWCFEMNGLLAWALKQIGFPVMLMAGTVNRAVYGDIAEGNHLVLRVDLERPYLADVGFGTGFLEPLPLAEGEYDQGFLTYQLSRTGDRWLFQHPASAGPGFDFTEQPHVLSDFAAQCHRLQTSPESGFVITTVCHRRREDGMVSMRGALLKTVTENGVIDRTLESFADYDRILRETFDLHLDDSVALWEKVWAKHQAWVKSMSAS